MPVSKTVLKNALGLLHSGKLAEAEKLCRRALARNPKDAEPLHMLGRIAMASGSYSVAACLIGQAIQLAGPHPALCLSLAAALEKSGQLGKAAACYLQALEQVPHDALVWLQLGRLFLRARELKRAKECFWQISILSATPSAEAADAQFELGNICHLQDDSAGAAEHYERALLYRPDHIEACFHLAVIRNMQGRLDEAADAYQRTLQLQPAHVRALNNLGILQQARGERAKARASYRKAIGRQPGYPDPYQNLGILEQDEERYDEALAVYRKLLSHQPGYADAHNNLGNVLLALNRPAEALDAYRRAVECRRDHTEASWNAAVTNLLLGNYEEGWRQYDARLWQPGAPPERFQEPFWDGSAFVGKSLLIHAEQGLGDTLQFIRYAPMVKARGGTVLVECQETLAALVSNVDGVDEVFPKGATLPDFDWQVPLLSLPRIFGTRIASIPCSPYLRPVPALVEQWRTLIEARSDKSSSGGLRRGRVGVVWSGNPDHKNDRNRSMPQHHVEWLAGSSRWNVFSLQASPLPVPAKTIALGGELGDFSDTAAAVASLDLVISVDTAVAHLCGAMGTPVWTVLPHAPDWRWMMDRPDSPWYPSMKLFRQPERKNWDAVMRQVGTELNRLSRMPQAD